MGKGQTIGSEAYLINKVENLSEKFENNFQFKGGIAPSGTVGVSPIHNDMNEAVETGIYSYYYTPANAPSTNANKYGTLIVIKTDRYITQMATDGDAVTYTRIFNIGNNAWSAWRTL